MKQKLIITTIICLMSVFSLFAQPTITFIPSDGVTLTRADVDSTLEANGLTRESEFHAIIEDAIEIASSNNYYKENAVFAECYNLLSVTSTSVIDIGGWAFIYCYSLEIINFPVAKLIGGYAFYRCESLIDANFPAVRLIDNCAFMRCENLTSIDFPSIAKIGHLVFAQCFSLIFAKFGTAFEEETEIEFGVAVFGDFTIDGGPILTPNINLILGKYVLPKPDLDENIWQNDYTYDVDYVWKSITIHTDIREEINNKYIYYLGNNTYLLDDIDDLNLYDVAGRNVRNYKNNLEVIDLNDLKAGAYFFNYFKNNKLKTEKIIKQ